MQPHGCGENNLLITNCIMMIPDLNQALKEDIHKTHCPIAVPCSRIFPQ